jgi:hypothetical protein
VRLGDLHAGREALAAAGIEAGVTDGVLRVSVPVAEAERVSRTLAERRLYVTELRPDEVDLETVFLELTSGEGLEP